MWRVKRMKKANKRELWTFIYPVLVIALGYLFVITMINNLP